MEKNYKIKIRTFLTEVDKNKKYSRNRVLMVSIIQDRK